MRQTGQCVKAGKHRSFLRTRRYVHGVRTSLPVLTVKGGQARPLAVIMAGQHGSELNGIASIERVFRQLNPQKLKGTVVFLPIMNPIGVHAHIEHYPIGEPYNMNRVWWDAMTSPDRSYAREIASAVWDTYLRHADVALDLHCCGGSPVYLPHAYTSKRNWALLHAFGVPCCKLTAKPSVPSCPGMAMSMATTHGIPAIIGELPSHHAIDAESVRLGERGILNILKFMGMLKGKLELPEYQYEFAEEDEEIAVMTPVEGLAVTDFISGQLARKGQTVVRILSLDTLSAIWEFRTPYDALIFSAGVVYRGNAPASSVVNSGQRVALLKKPRRIIHNHGDLPCLMSK